MSEAVTAHAAVGKVRGQRLPDGTAPQYVDIEYERHGTRREARVHRENHVQQVEFSDGDTCRFWTEDNEQVIVDELLNATPVDTDD